MKKFDKFFSKHDFSEPELVSNCCSAAMFGEPINIPIQDRVYGRCAKCYEIAEFVKEEK